MITFRLGCPRPVYPCPRGEGWHAYQVALDGDGHRRYIDVHVADDLWHRWAEAGGLSAVHDGVSGAIALLLEFRGLDGIPDPLVLRAEPSHSAAA